MPLAWPMMSRVATALRNCWPRRAPLSAIAASEQPRNESEPVLQFALASAELFQASLPDLGLGESLSDAAVVIVHPVVVQSLLGEGLEVTAQLLQGVYAGAHIILRQGLGVGPGVGDGLVAFVKGLGQFQCAAGGKSVLPIGLALEGG